jgi:hypothetical protein
MTPIAGSEENSMNDNIDRDLRLREVEVAAFIVQNENNEFQVISYNDKGLVKFISPFAKILEIYKRGESGLHNPLATIEIEKDTTEST